MSAVDFLLQAAYFSLPLGLGPVMTLWQKKVENSTLWTLRNRNCSVVNLYFVKTMTQTFWHALLSVSLSSSIQTGSQAPHETVSLQATGGKKLVTTSPTEPLLAEAACDLLQRTLMDPIDYFAQSRTWTASTLGDVVSWLRLKQARDQVAKEKDGCVSLNLWGLYFLLLYDSDLLTRDTR